MLQCLQWETGDFIIIDNLALAHAATKDSNMEPYKVGLRVLHRVTVEGTSVTSKNPMTNTPLGTNNDMSATRQNPDE